MVALSYAAISKSSATPSLSVPAGSEVRFVWEDFSAKNGMTSPTYYEVYRDNTGSAGLSDIVQGTYYPEQPPLSGMPVSKGKSVYRVIPVDTNKNALAIGAKITVVGY